MLDWLASKLGALIAVGVMTAFVLGFFAWHHSSLADREGQAVADSIADAADSLAGLEAGAVLSLSFGGTGLLPSEIGGETYTVNISAEMATVRAGSRAWVSHFVERCIPRNLSERHMNLTEFRGLDFSGWTGEHESTGHLILERAVLEVSGKAEHVTLAYWGG